ncbi:flavin monoamine oxidase family protein [Isoptericola sp. NPDC019693]|uniref:flavin monoamine oxidase family protein n=1 Tax=Isoptericola sp. NPDC019693 TaxID=3364009 RepID=UPI0037BDC7AF
MNPDQHVRPEPGTGGSATETDVVVVGAGISGLVASLVLADAGQDVLCLEARDRVGGRALTVTTETGPVDLGATWWWPNEPQIRALLHRLGVDSFEQYLGGDALAEMPDSSTVRVEGNPLDVPSFRVRGGTQSLAQALHDALPAGTVRLRHQVTSITTDADGVTVTTTAPAHVRRDEETLRDEETVSIRARAVVLALPPALAVGTIALRPAPEAGLLRTARETAVWMGDAVKAVAVYDDAFWRSAGLAGAGISHRGPFREFHDMSDDAGRAPAIFGFARAATFQGQSDAEIADVFLTQLATLFGPAAKSPRVVRVKDWSRDRWTTPAGVPAGSTATFGDAGFQPQASGASPDRVYWASTETSTAFAGHLEGAIHGGTRAARAILRSHP